MRFSLDRTWRRPDSGNVVIAGSPTRAFTLTNGGLRVAEDLERGNDVPDSAKTLIDRFVDAGAVHPLPDASTPRVDPTTITAVIPFFSRDAQSTAHLTKLVSGLEGLGDIIVVDDASPIAFATPTADGTNIELLLRPVNGGPAAARNAGLERVTTPLVVFVDDDVSCTTDDIVALATWKSASMASAIAPRVRTDDDDTTLGAYEAARSPLDMGDRPARVRAGTRISYVPATVLLCDTTAAREIGGFDESMRTGEDVDFVWRLEAMGLSVRYEPAVEVLHARRATLSAMLAQRAGYGESTTSLRRRHGAAVAPARGSWPTIGSWLALVAGLPIIACIAAASSGVLLARKLRFAPNHVVESARLAAMTQLQVGRNLASAVTRVWWPIAFVIALFSRRARLALCAAALVPALTEWWDARPRLDPLRFTLLRIVDDAAYGVGVWRGVVRERDLRALTPVIHGPTPQNG